MGPKTGLSIEIAPLGTLDSLQHQWRVLENRSDGGFFRSWSWISAWLSQCAGPLLLITAKDGERIVALGILGRHVATRRGIVKARQLLLHETGDPALDRLFVEHNGLLIDPDYADGLESRIFATLRDQAGVLGWDEMVLGGVGAETMRAASDSLHVVTDRVLPSFAVDLACLRTERREWLTSLSRNTAGQIARARRFAERDGPLTLTVAGTVDEALEFFDELRGLHEARWHARNAPGAFSSPQVLAFHRRLIQSAFGRGEIQLCRGNAGDRLLGYLYNFRYRGRVSNYQSGFKFGDDNRHKPGLLMHGLAIEHAIATGDTVYDFLAGDARFKSSLAEASTELVWCRAQLPRLSLALERRAVALGRAFRALKMPQ